MDVVREFLVVACFYIGWLDTLFENGVATRWVVEWSIWCLRHAEESRPDGGPSSRPQRKFSQRSVKDQPNGRGSQRLGYLQRAPRDRQFNVGSSG